MVSQLAVQVISLSAQSVYRLDYGMDGRDSIPEEEGNTSLRHRCVRTGSEADLTYPMGTGGSFLEGKAAGDNTWSYTSTPPYVFRAWYLAKHRNNVLVGKPEGKRKLGRPRRGWEDNIRMHLREVG
jgi:hypothetical protein